MYEVIEIKKTCGACPSQWEGRLEDGRHIYCRFRWGILEIGVGDTLDDAVGSTEEYHDSNHPLDGVMDYEELIEWTKGKFTWPKV